MKKKDLYLESGYLNMPMIIELPFTFIWVIGARGIGKTYGGLEYCIEKNKRFLLTRRLQVQSEILATPDMNPFKQLNTDKGWEIAPFRKNKYVYNYYNYHTEKGKQVAEKEQLYGYGGALSTFANVRGFDGSDIELLLYDEFIPQANERFLKFEAESFFNMVETVNRNRELLGRPALKVVCMSNSTEAANPLFLELGLVTRVMKMQEDGEFYYEDGKRDMCVIIPANSPVSEAKKGTALYRLTQGTSFYDSALENKFTNNTPTNIISRPLQEYKCILNVGEIWIYRHKSRNRLYVTTRRSYNVPSYGCTQKELMICRKRYGKLIFYVYSGEIDYENYTCEVLFDRYLNVLYN